MIKWLIRGFIVALFLELPLWYSHSRETTFYYIQAQEVQYLTGNLYAAQVWCLENEDCSFFGLLLYNGEMIQLINKVKETKYIQVDYLTKIRNFYLVW